MNDSKLKRNLSFIQMIAISSGAVIGGWLAEAPYWFQIPLDPLLAQTDEQVGELGSGQPRGILHGDGPFLMSLLTLFTGHHTSWERAIIISFPGNAARRPLNNLH